MKLLLFVTNTGFFRVEIIPEIAQIKYYMVFVCDATVFDEKKKPRSLNAKGNV